jgi:uncharacterized protein DUF2795
VREVKNLKGVYTQEVDTRAYPLELQRFLRGVTYPVSRDELIEYATLEGLDDASLHALQAIADRPYFTPSDVQTALGTMMFVGA